MFEAEIARLSVAAGADYREVKLKKGANFLEFTQLKIRKNAPLMENTLNINHLVSFIQRTKD